MCLIQYNEKDVDSHLRRWAAATTKPDTERWHEIIKDKVQSNQHFFGLTRKDPNEVRSEDIMTWIDHLHNDGLTPQTIRRKVSSLRSFFDWFIRDEHQEMQNPVEGIVIRRPKPLPEPDAISYDDLVTVLHVAAERRNQGDLSAQRDLLLLLFAFITDLKRSEILRIQRRHIQLTSYELYIRPTVAITDLIKVKNSIMRELTREHLAAMQDTSPHAPLWTRHDRAGKPGQQLSSQSVGYSLHRYTKAAGLGTLSLQDLRVAFNRHMHAIAYDRHKELSADEKLEILFSDLRWEE